MPFQLVVQLPEGRSLRVLREGANDVGSARGADVRLEHVSVSRRHARVLVDEDRVEIEDLGSRNGTRTDGERVDGTRQAVEAGGRLTFGSVECRLERVDGADLETGVSLESATAPPPPVERPRSVGPPASTAATGGLSRFTLERLPEIVGLLEERATTTTLAQALGSALADSLPCRSVRIVRRAGGGEEGVLFRADHDETPGESESEEIVELDGLAIVVDFRHPLQARSFRPLLETAARLLRLRRPEVPAKRAKPPVEPPPLPVPRTVDSIVQRIYRDASRIARGSVSVLITGDSGTGKEVLARYLHAASRRAAGPFLALNCAALPRDLLEAELFGVESGVATGVSPRAGKFELADEGTLFLDEIGDMEAATQAKILRVLQEGEVYRLGGQEPRPARARILAATNRDVDRLLESEAFRSDLFHRIADWRVRLPPLRERRRDIPNLAAHFLAEEAARHGVAPAGISRATLEVLQSHSWPGNVRQLQREMARAVLFLEDGDLLQTRHLQEEIREPEEENAHSLEAKLERVERREIEAALRRARGNATEAARELDVSRSTFYRRMRELGVGPGEAED